jgi:hypothetical protein
MAPGAAATEGTALEIQVSEGGKLALAGERLRELGYAVEPRPSGLIVLGPRASAWPRWATVLLLVVLGLPVLAFFAAMFVEMGRDPSLSPGPRVSLLNRPFLTGAVFHMVAPFAAIAGAFGYGALLASFGRSCVRLGGGELRVGTSPPSPGGLALPTRHLVGFRVEPIDQGGTFQVLAEAASGTTFPVWRSTSGGEDEAKALASLARAQLEAFSGEASEDEHP